MKTVLTTILLTAFILNIDAQNFQGKVLYQTHYTGKTAKFSANKIISGSTQEYYIKDGYYKSYVNGKNAQCQVYNGETNRLYNKSAKSDTIYGVDASVNENEVLSSEIIENKETVLGMTCNALILTTKNGTETYYYNSKYTVDAGQYKNHNYGNWYYVVSKTGAIPLKIVIETNDYIMESTAIEVAKMELEKEFFSMPAAPVKEQ